MQYASFFFLNRIIKLITVHWPDQLSRVKLFRKGIPGSNFSAGNEEEIAQFVLWEFIFLCAGDKRFHFQPDPVQFL
jgi:hypothetical protein